jgi:hypothetical protein
MSEENIREAILEKLEENATILAAGIYYGLAPQGTDLPYVLFQEFGDGDPLWTMAGPPLVTVPWLIKGVGDSSDAETLNYEIKKTLSRAVLTIDGYTNLYCNYHKTVAYSETPNGERYEHRGAIYKITTEEVV